LILLASPEAARSEWVDREVTWWLGNKDPGRVFVALTGGRFAVADRDGAAADAALPPSMAAVPLTGPATPRRH
jgi:hypothetical protein